LAIDIERRVKLQPLNSIKLKQKITPKTIVLTIKKMKNNYIRVNYTPLLSNMLELHTCSLLCLNIHFPHLKRKMYTPSPIKYLNYNPLP